MIQASDIYAATEDGKAVILHYYPQAMPGFTGRRNFKLRDDDKNPSCTVFKSKDGHWLIQDKGGADTKAYNAISLVMEKEHMTFPQAIDHIAKNFAPHLLAADSSAGPVTGPQPDMIEVAPQSEITVKLRESGEFTPAELAVLGHNITPEVCADLCLKPLDSYITIKNEKGKSWQISSNENYPIFFYDYGTYGKIYQPFGGRYRFLWTGSKDDKQANPISGEREFMDRFRKARKGEWRKEIEVTGEDGETETQDMTWDSLILCSGGSDALNVHNAGYHVCWMNSETANLTEHEFKILSDLAKKVYILYDIDETGIRQMYDIALRFLDINLILLPDELKERRHNGKPCKDAKDFFMYFRRPENQDPFRLFDELVKLSGGLKFWSAVRQKNGTYKYDINNEQMYTFLNASGFYTIEHSAAPEGFTFCRIQRNVVTLIDKAAITGEVSKYLLEYLRTHPKYYSQQLVNAIHRSKQINTQSLAKLRMVKPNFRAFTEDADFFWFRNGIFKVTAKGISKVDPGDCPYMVYSSKIIDHDFTPEGSMFDIHYQEQYRALLNQLSQLSPTTPNYYAVGKLIDAVDDTDRYRLEVKRTDCTFMQYVFDTGRAYWRKEEAGYSLNPDEQAETELNFISKVMAMGYMLSKHKNAGQPYAVYAMEMEQADEGEHLGGTGKSLFFNAIEQMRSQVYVDAQRMKEDKMQFAFQSVVRGVTDTIFMDDMNNSINLHTFMNMITGKMVVEVKHAASFTLDYEDSPKICWTSNHAIRNFDDSLNRRIWFAAFSDYYHSDSRTRKLVERSPRTKFGKDLIKQYTPEEMNHFYNFMMNCIMVWKKIRVRVQPPMKAILQRTLKKAMTDEFLWWAEDWFTEDRLDVLVDRDEAFNAYKGQLSATAAQMIKPNTFKKKVMDFCTYKDWIFNPEDMLHTESERARNDIRQKVDGVNRYYFYIDTKKGGPHPSAAPTIGGPGDEIPAGDDIPIF